jgi:hypothetical protein
VAAAASPPTRAEVYQQLGVDHVAADYGILVDTSASMKEGDLYGQVRGALRPLLDALSPQDHLSLITFDSVPTVRFSDRIGGSASQALGRLPAEPAGKFTDLGAAIGEALREFERPDAAGVNTLLLLTDGRHDPAAGSSYPTTSGQAWTALADRAHALRGRHRVSAFGIELGSGPTDAGLLQRVFSQASVLALPPGQIGGYLERVKLLTSAEKARAILASDRGGAVTVTWSGDSLSHLDLNRGHARVTVTLHSSMVHVPLELSGFRLSSTGLPIKASSLPEHLRLAPRGARAFQLDLAFPALGGFGLGRHTVHEHGTLALAAAVTPSWDRVLRDDLGMPLRPPLRTGAVPTRGSGRVGWSFLTLGALLALALALVGLVRLRSVRRKPRLRGSLSVIRDGEELLASDLRGRKARLGKGSLRLPEGKLEGSLMAVRRQARGDPIVEHGVKVVARANGRAQRAVLWSGGSLTVGDYQIQYTDD